METFLLTTDYYSLPLVGDRYGGVNATAEADVIEGVDDLGEDEDIDDAALGDRPTPNCNHKIFYSLSPFCAIIGGNYSGI